MTQRLRAIWQAVNASYWFYPGLFAVLGLFLALITVQLDRSGWSSWLNDVPWIEPVRPQGASNMLTVIAGSMIGVASTVFSITIAAVAYASGNYGPRLLTNFMENRGNQLSLATFIGTFVYAITTLRTVRSSEEQIVIGMSDSTAAPGFVPQLSLLVAFALAGLAVAVLVYFLHHVPASIRINSVLRGIGERLLADIDRMFPDKFDGEVDQEAPHGRAVIADAPGYVQRIDFERLQRIAKAAGGHIKLGVRTGDFVHSGVPLVYWADDDDLDDLHDKEIRDSISLGGTRTPVQDLHFLIDELVEIGLRALSPGINDPFTAVIAMHWLGAATARLGRRNLVRSFGNSDSADGDRIVTLDDDFAHYLRRGFGALRSAVAESPIAAQVAFDTLAKSTIGVGDAARLDAVRKEAAHYMEQAREALTGPDLDAVKASYDEFLDRMSRHPA